MAESRWHSLGHFTGEINTRFAQNYILDSMHCYQSDGIHIIMMYIYIYE